MTEQITQTTFRQKLEEEYRLLNEQDSQLLLSSGHITQSLAAAGNIKTQIVMQNILAMLISSAEEGEIRRKRIIWLRKMISDRRNLSDANLLVRYLKGP